MSRNRGRRSFLRAGGTAGMVTLAGCSSLLGGGNSTAGWPMFQGGPAHRGANPSAGPGESLNVRWKRQAGEVTDQTVPNGVFPMVSPPVAAGDLVYATLTFRGAREPRGTALLAFDRGDGSVRWRTELLEGYNQTMGGNTVPCPAVASGTVVVSVPNLATPVSAIGVDAASGDVRWRDEGERLVSTSPTARNGRLVFGGDTAFALTADGTFDWEYSREDPSWRAALEWPPAVDGSGAYVPTTRRLVALDREGTLRWSRDLTYESSTWEIVTTPYAPTLGDAVYVATGAFQNDGDGRLLALDPADGRTRWEFKPEFDPDRRLRLFKEAVREDPDRAPFFRKAVGVYGTPALLNGTLYAMGLAFAPDAENGLSAPALYAIDAATGEKEWSTRLPGTRFSLGAPVVGDRFVYAFTGDGVAALDAQSGRHRTTAASGDSFPGSMALAGNALFFSDVSQRSIVALGP